MTNITRWALSKPAKIHLANDPNTEQAQLSMLLKDEDSEVRAAAACNVRVNPNDLIQAIKEHPELRMAGPQPFLVAEWMKK